MGGLLSIAAGRTAKWVIALVWLLIAFTAGALNLPAKFADAEKNESSSFLPGDAESTLALNATKRLQAGEQAPMVAIFRRPDGLTAADGATIQRRIARFNAERARLAGQGKDPFRRTTDFRRTAAT